ncbi:MAG: hypothetical protein HY321_02245 [Armatimonadetes bacterium]|nr:hypothetical protein [Armatimonadota bacterium]
MESSDWVLRRSSRLRWRQGSVNLVLAALAGWALRDWEPNFLLLGLFPFGVLRLVQGTELRLGLVLTGWTDIPFTPVVIGAWAASAVSFQRLLRAPSLEAGIRVLLWIAIGIALYAIGRWVQARYYQRYVERES